MFLLRISERMKTGSERNVCLTHELRTFIRLLWVDCLGDYHCRLDYPQPAGSEERICPELFMAIVCAKKRGIWIAKDILRRWCLKQLQEEISQVTLGLLGLIDVKHGRWIIPFQLLEFLRELLFQFLFPWSASSWFQWVAKGAVTYELGSAIPVRFSG